MRCYCCDKELSDKEVIYNEEMKSYEPCTTCLDIAMDAAYSDGFQIEDDGVVVLDTAFDLGDSGDIVPRYKEEDFDG